MFIFQMTNDVEHPFKCLLVIHMSLVKYLFKSFPHFEKCGSLSFYYYCNCSLYIQNTRASEI